MIKKLPHPRTTELLCLMAENDLNQVDAARLIGCSRSMVNAWTQGKQVIPEARLRLLKFEIKLRKQLTA